MDSMFILSLTHPFWCSEAFLKDRRSQMYTDKMCELLNRNPKFVLTEVSVVILEKED